MQRALDEAHGVHARERDGRGLAAQQAAAHAQPVAVDEHLEAGEGDDRAGDRQQPGGDEQARARGELAHRRVGQQVQDAVAVA